MDVFGETEFYAPSGESTHSWTGQGGGVEGLHQYIWVSLYDAVIRLKLIEIGFKSHTMIKGDDFIAAVQIPKTFIASQGLDHVVDLIKLSLKEACLNIGKK